MTDLSEVVGPVAFRTRFCVFETQVAVQDRGRWEGRRQETEEAGLRGNTRLRMRHDCNWMEKEVTFWNQITLPYTHDG